MVGHTLTTEAGHTVSYPTAPVHNPRPVSTVRPVLVPAVRRTPRILPRRNHEADSGRFTDAYPPEDVIEAIHQSGGRAASSEIVASRGRSRETADRTVRLVVERDHLKRWTLAGVRILSIAEHTDHQRAPMTVRRIEQEAATSPTEQGVRRVPPRRRAASWTGLRSRDAPHTARQSAGRVAGTVVARP